MNETLKETIDAFAIPCDDPNYSWFIEGLNWPKLKYWEGKYDHLMEFSTLSAPSLHFIEQIVKSTNHLGGACVEFGVYKGTSAYVIAGGTTRPLYCFDSFKGLPDPEEIDGLESGLFSDTDPEDVKALVPNANLVIGDLPGTLIEYNFLNITFAHVDLDYRSATELVLSWLRAHMTAGIIVIDDYGNCATKGVKKAVDDFCHTFDLVAIPMQTGQAFIIL